MNSPITLLRALKGTCALHCLVALHLAGPLPVSLDVIMDLTGYDDGAVLKGLRTLLALGLVTCTGVERRRAWQLAPAAQSLPLPLPPLFETPEKRGYALEEKEQEKGRDKEKEVISYIDSAAVDSAEDGQTRKAGLAAPGSDSTVSNKSGESARRSRASHPRKPGQAVLAEPAAFIPSADKASRSQLYAIFEAAEVYIQFRRTLADALLAEDREQASDPSPGAGPAWVQQALGWLCYAARREPRMRRGAVIYISLRDRLPCDPAYFPPPELTFPDALAWALGGGEAEPDDDENDDDVDDNDDDKQTLRVLPGDLVSPVTRESRVWEAVLARLAHELPRSTVETQLRPVRLISLDDQRAILAAPNPQARDWLAARLSGVLARTLRDLTGRELAVEVNYEPNDG